MSLKLLIPDIGDFDNVEIIEVLVKKGIWYINNSVAPVAQLARALGYGPGGSGFNS